jgi:DNA-binding NarL/FixJ family response regulator
MVARLLIADDHQVVRQGLRDMLAGCPDMSIVAEAADGLEAERLARSLALDLIVLDMALPGKRGIEVLKDLRAGGVDVPVVFFSMYEASQFSDAVKRAGGQCFISKGADGDSVIACLRSVLAGNSCFVRLAPPPAGEQAAFARLSVRELDVLRGLRRGLPAKTIAVQLGITDKSVATYRRRILDKLGVANNAELIARSIDWDSI